MKNVPKTRSKSCKLGQPLSKGMAQGYFDAYWGLDYCSAYEKWEEAEQINYEHGRLIVAACRAIDHDLPEPTKVITQPIIVAYNVAGGRNLINI